MRGLLAVSSSASLRAHGGPACDACTTCLRYLPAIPACDTCLRYLFAWWGYLLAVSFAALAWAPVCGAPACLRLPAVPVCLYQLGSASTCTCLRSLFVAIACRNYVHCLLVVPACVVMPAYGTCLLYPWSLPGSNTCLPCLLCLLAVPTCLLYLLAVTACCTCLLYVYLHSLALLARYACLRCIFLSCTCSEKSACCAVSAKPTCRAHMRCLRVVRASRTCLSYLPTTSACDFCLRCLPAGPACRTCLQCDGPLACSACLLVVHISARCSCCI